MNLTRNVGSIDKTVRLIAGLALVGWGLLAAGIGSAAGLIATIVGVVLLVTGAVSFCPLFKILGITSNGGK